MVLVTGGSQGAEVLNRVVPPALCGLRRPLQVLHLSGEGNDDAVRSAYAVGGEYGLDLESVAENAGISVQEVIDIHSGTDYLVYMMGFAPGFPYLGGLDQRLHTPRLTTPRTEIPPGSVGIAESQTGVYPIASPGGWRLIGRTPVAMFDPAISPPALLSTGNYVRFEPISAHEYGEIKSKASSGEYTVVTEPKL